MNSPVHQFRTAFPAGLAGILAVLINSTSQAEDLPVTQPGEHATVCANAPAGFFRIAGTDVCLRVTGEVYGQTSSGIGKELAIQTGYNAGQPLAVSGVTDLAQQFRSQSSYGEIGLETRSQTDLGLLFTSVRLRGSMGSGTLQEGYAHLAGVTAGHRSSLFDIGTTGYAETPGLTSDRKTNLLAYTRNVARDLKLTVSAEEGTLRRFSEGVWSQYAGQRYPDLVVALDYEPARGWIHGAAAVHDVKDLRGSSSEIGWAAVAGTGYRFRYSDKSSGKFVLSGAVSRGALDYLGIPANAPDYIRSENGQLHLTSGASGMFAYEHVWRPEFRSAVTASLYRTRTKADSLEWNSGGFWLTLGSEYMLVPGLSVGADFTYYLDSVWSTGQQPTETDAQSVVGYGYMRRTF